jgi:hypothetical protein
MSAKWIDNESYLGPDRRRRGLGKRWGDRRRYDEAGEPPPLGAVLRRLRVQLFDMKTPDDRQRALQLAHLAITEAENRKFPACAEEVRKAVRFINAGDTASAEARVIEAQAILGGVAPR